MKVRITPVDVELGKRLRVFRRNAGLNQRTLATAVGLTFQQIQKYEYGLSRISARTLFEMANVLGVNIAQFFDGLKPASRRLKPGKPALKPSTRPKRKN